MKLEDFEYLNNHEQGKEDLATWFQGMHVDERVALDSLLWTCEGLNDKRSNLLKVSPQLLNDIRTQFRKSKEPKKSEVEQDLDSAQPENSAQPSLQRAKGHNPV